MGRNRQSLALLAAILLVGSVVFAVVGASEATSEYSGPSSAVETPEPDETESDINLSEPADEVYVKDNGDVILVYTNESDPETSQAEFGLSVSESVFHALVVSDRTDASNATGALSAVLEPDRLSGSGGMRVPSTDEVDSLSFELSGEQTDETARFDSSLSATLSQSGAAGVMSKATSQGTVTITPDQFSASGSYQADLRSPLGEPTHESYSITETGDKYVIQVERNTTISTWFAEQWNSSENASKALEAQYGSLAANLGGTADIDISSYTFTNESSDQWTAGRLQIAFTVTYTDIDAGLAEQVATDLQESESYDVTQSEAQAVGQAVADVSLEEISASYSLTNESMSSSFTAGISNFYPALRESVTLMQGLSLPENETSEQLREQLDDAEKRLKAWKASDLEQTHTFDFSMERQDESTVALDSSFAYRTDNWAAFRSELESRGIETATTNLALTAETTGEDVVVNGSFEIEQADLIEGWFEDKNGSMSLDREQRQFVEALRDGEFRKAKFDASLTEETVTFEAGAAFENMSALRNVIVETDDDFNLTVASIVGETDGANREVYVLTKGAVDADATEEDVRVLSQVGEETTINMPGEWDREFPEPDVEGAYEYLGLPVPDQSTPTPNESATGGTDGTATGSSSNTSVPGFGVQTAVVVLALLTVALFTRRREQ